MFFKPKAKMCKICSAPIEFEFIIRDTLQGKKIDNPEQSIYCKQHFIKKIEESIKGFNDPFIFYKPIKFSKNSNMFYYMSKTLLKDRYTKEDYDDILNLLLSANLTVDTNIVLLDGEVIKCANDAPLFKIKNPKCQVIDKNTFIHMLSDYLLELNNTFSNKGSFWFVLPYLEKGIYVWFDYQ